MQVVDLRSYVWGVSWAVHGKRDSRAKRQGGVGSQSATKAVVVSGVKPRSRAVKRVCGMVSVDVEYRFFECGEADEGAVVELGSVEVELAVKSRMTSLAVGEV